MDVEDLVEYFSTLRRGYDRVIFCERVKELGEIVDATPLSPDDFGQLFRVWLRLEIPISTWSKMGACLVPIQPLETALVSHVARWLLSALHGEVSVSRLGFVLNWLTAALDHNLVSPKDLDKFYFIFHTIFQQKRYANHSAKLLYTLTKPTDVTRQWTQYLISLLTSRQTAREKAQILALLSLYKSYRPECVPENIPVVSVRSAFPKINAAILKRFARVQEYLSTVDSSPDLKWRTHLSEKGVHGRGYKVRRLVPDTEFINIGSELYSNKNSENYLHFKDGVSVLCLAMRAQPRPAQLCSLLCNEAAGITLAVMPRDEQAFFSHDLLYQLEACFLRPDPWHQYNEKADFLNRIAHLQQSLLQGIPVVTSFLADFLPTWNGCDYFEQVLMLLEWARPLSLPELHACVLQPLQLLYQTLPHLSRLAILRTLAAMYNNMAYSLNRESNFFLSAASKDDHMDTLKAIEELMQELCLDSLCKYPGNSTVLDSVLSTYSALARAQLGHGVPACSVLPPAAAAAALVSCSHHSLESLAGCVLLQRKVFAKLLRRNEINSEEHLPLLTSYKNDILNCLLRGRALSDRDKGAMLKYIPQRCIEDIFENLPDADKSLTLGRHIALAPYTYMRCEDMNLSSVTSEVWFNHVVKHEFKNLTALLEKIDPNISNV